MFSSVFDKVVSATAPDAMATFPPRATLPVPSSTLCCLSFADRFLSHYPTARAPMDGFDGSYTGGHLVGRAGTTGIAVSADELESTMQSAAELGARLAAALAETARSKTRGPATVPVSDLLVKVRGIFGNRLTCVGREIRVSRNTKAERDETLLLRQVHALKNAALEACNGEKWCILVSSGGESLAVCSVPVPPVEEGGSCGCDFFVFDPWPRPAMKLRGSYIIKFTTVRGLQLHLLSALGEIWKNKGLPKEDRMKTDFVGLCVVMAARGEAAGLVDVEARRLLEDSVTKLRKAEKATAIKLKREEVEALRKALGGTTRKHPTDIAPFTGGKLGATDSSSRQPMPDDDDNLREKVAICHSSEQRRREQGTPRENAELPDLHLQEKSTSEGDIDALKSDVEVAASKPAPITARKSLESAAAVRAGLTVEQALDHHFRLPNSHDSSSSRPQLQLPVADVSPPLSLKRSEEDGRARWREEYHIYRPSREGSQDSEAAELETTGIGAANQNRGARDSPIKTGGESNGRVERAGEVKRLGEVDGGGYSSGQQNDMVISDDRLHRALLRSIEGEGLEEYSKRAYNIYRINGVIKQGVLDEEQLPEASPDFLLSSTPLDCRPATSSTVVRAAAAASPSATPHEISNKRLPAARVDKCKVVGQDCSVANTGVRERVRPFSPPVSPQNLGLERNHLSNRGGDDGVSRKSFTALASSAINEELRVVDLSEAEEAMTYKPDETEAPPKRFRSRLRAPRAGRVLALASANALGNLGRRLERSPDLRGEPSESSLPLSLLSTALPTQRKEAWNERVVEQELGGRDNADIVVDKNDTVRRGVVASEKEKDSAFRNGNHQRRASRRKNEGVGVAAAAVCNSDDDSPRTKLRRQVGSDDNRSRNRSSATLGVGRRGYFERKPSDDYADAYDEREPLDSYRGRPAQRPTVNEACIRIASTGPAHPPPLKACRPLATSIHPGQDSGQLQTPHLETQPGRKSGMATRGSHRDRSVEGDDVEPVSEKTLGVCKKAFLAETDKASDGDAFVWFGQPDSPSARRLDESDDMGGRARAEMPKQEDRGPQHVRQHRSKAKLLLQMEVRRQRDIIECAFQAREEEGRLRKARIGAEVLKRIQAFRQTARSRAGPSTTSPSTCPSAPHPTEKPEISKHPVRRTGIPQGEANPAADSIASPCHPERIVKAWGFRPVNDRVDTDATRTRSEPMPDVSLVGEAVGKGPAGAPVPTPLAESAPRVVAGNPWRHVTRQVGLEDVSAKGVPTPAPISFDVTADGLGNGEAWLGGGTSREQARRQERYEALRARKLIEAEERRRSLKERQVVAKEVQQRDAATAAAAAADERYVQGAREEARRQALAQQDMSIVDSPSMRTGRSPGAPMARPRSSSIRNTENGYADRGCHAPTDSNGSGGRVGGGGVARIPSSGAARIASPAVRSFSRRSNRKLVRNAMNFLCLAGGHLQEKKTRALKALDSHLASNFVVLLAHTKLLAFKGLYACSEEEDGTAERVFGLGPPQLDTAMVSGFYKYNSAAREFREVHSKTLGTTTDAVSMEPTRLRRSKGMAAQPTP